MRLLLTAGLAIISPVIFAQNVGIGTNNPTSPLTIKADAIGLSQESSDGSARIGFYTQAGSSWLQTHNKTNLRFTVNNGVTRMVLDTLYNVGIGNFDAIAPAARLHVQGNDNMELSIYASNSKNSNPTAGALSGVAAVYGEMTNTVGGGYSAAVKGINRSTTSSGIGVMAYHAGSGWGVYGEAPGGVGVYGVTTTGSAGYFKAFGSGNALGTQGKLSFTGIGEGQGKVLTSDASGNATWQTPAVFSLPYEGSSSTDPLSGGLFKIISTGAGNPAYFEIANTSNTGEALFATSNGNNGAAIRGRNNGTGRAGWFTATSSANTRPALVCETYGTGGALEAISMSSSRDIAIFSNNNGRVARIDGVGKGYFNGGTQTGGADIAEAFAVENNRADYEPGDVLVISQTTNRTVTKSSEAYSTLVVGVYATKPGVLLTERMENDNMSDLVPMGVIGVIPTKVCSEGGSIRRGDLLVTASRTGYAMKGKQKKLKPGNVIGKALEDFTGDTGMINVLVNVK